MKDTTISSKKVYRIEYRKKGIYRVNPISTKLLLIILDMNNDHAASTHPGLYRDFKHIQISKKLYNLAEYYTGCSSIKSLKSWFGDYYDKLLQYNYVNVVQYEVKKYVKGLSKIQVAYKKEDIIKRTIIK